MSRELPTHLHGIRETPTGLEEGLPGHPPAVRSHAPVLPDVVTTRLMIADAESVLGAEHRMWELIRPGAKGMER